jgi:hypothetical protein
MWRVSQFSGDVQETILIKLPLTCFYPHLNKNTLGGMNSIKFKTEDLNPVTAATYIPWSSMSYKKFQ